MAAFVAQTNECVWCTKAHAAVADRAYRDAAKVSAALSDLKTAAIEEPLRATLRMLRKLTREHAVDADDMRAVLAAGVSREQIDDALGSAGRCLRVLRAKYQGLRGWREVPASARLPLTMTNSLVSTGPCLLRDRSL